MWCVHLGESSALISSVVCLVRCHVSPCFLFYLIAKFCNFCGLFSIPSKAQTWQHMVALALHYYLSEIEMFIIYCCIMLFALEREKPK